MGNTRIALQLHNSARQLVFNGTYNVCHLGCILFLGYHINFHLWCTLCQISASLSLFFVGIPVQCRLFNGGYQNHVLIYHQLLCCFVFDIVWHLTSSYHSTEGTIWDTHRLFSKHSLPQLGFNILFIPTRHVNIVISIFIFRFHFLT